MWMVRTVSGSFWYHDARNERLGRHIHTGHDHSMCILRLQGTRWLIQAMSYG